MKTFIFITDEGFTFQPGSESSEPDIENSQVLGFAEGKDIDEAFVNLVRENEYLLQTTFDEVKGFEINEKTEKLFCLNDIKNCSIL